MIKDIEKIESQSGMVEPSGTIGALPLLRLRASKIRPEVHRESRGTDILNCGGVYWQTDAATPLQYDHVKIFPTYDTVEITVFNRAEALSSAPDGKILRMDRLLDVLKKFFKHKRKG